MEKINPILQYNPYVTSAQVIGTNQNQAVNQKVNEIGTSQGGAIPFGGLTGRTESPVAPAEAKQNYQNGLAPLSNLQNVYAGEINGKENILNQIGIA